MPSSEVDARTALEAAAELGPYFAWQPRDADAGWRPFADLLEPSVVAERVRAGQRVLMRMSGRSSDEIDERVVASTVFLGLASRLLSPLLAAAALTRVVPLATPDHLWWRPTETGPMPIAYEHLSAIRLPAAASEVGRPANDQAPTTGPPAATNLPGVPRPGAADDQPTATEQAYAHTLPSVAGPGAADDHPRATGQVAATNVPGVPAPGAADDRPPATGQFAPADLPGVPRPGGAGNRPRATEKAAAAIIPGANRQPAIGNPILPTTPVGATEQMDAAELLSRTAVSNLVGPVLEAFRERFVLSPQVMWGNVASALGGAAGMIADHVTAPAAAGASAAIVAGMLARGPLTGTASLERPDPRRARWFLVRNNCCLYYRLPGGGTCGDCILTPDAVRRRHWQRMLNH
ncbi:(2Fe-2S)-binding protein [Actinoplanes sp. Pm04-4]|uniref:(2Fe-2S)-binding protein n=1 Tax=Paractinoplanes pyxinae TaxID=2997416 RepID=A0ABT4BC77_9ACTN|nr:(2Fe-2S)-binding protein [Actinoplanes pyxinae]MCY1143203.1 (2Fe-2S)-binding protein [Actinoplanes pyxinae]